MATRRPAVPVLRRIGIGGFKSFRDPVEVDIRRLTLLAGANSSGKSSLLQPLLLMKQTLEAPYDPGALLLDGPLVRAENAETLFWRGRLKTDRAREWWIGSDHGEGMLRTAYRPGSPRRGGLEVAWLEGMGDGIRLSSPLGESEQARLIQVLPARLGFSNDHQGPRAVSVAPERAGFRVSLTWGASSRPDRPPGVNWHISPAPWVMDLLHLPGLRGNPRRAYPVTRPGEAFPGAFPDYTAGVLLGWRERDDARLREVGDDLRHLGLSWKVDPRQRTDTAVEIHVGRLPGPQQGGAQDVVNIADVGFGLSQVLPVVVALRVAQEGHVLHIEQPELHLHPRAQVAMADLLLAAAARGATVICETHSSVLLRAVQTRVAEGQAGLPADEVALHWFRRGEQGESIISSGTLDSAGTYGDWPVDFDDVELEVNRRLIEASFARASGE